VGSILVQDYEIVSLSIEESFDRRLPKLVVDVLVDRLSALHIDDHYSVGILVDCLEAHDQLPAVFSPFFLLKHRQVSISDS
jgi:hypothetical protein